VRALFSGGRQRAERRVRRSRNRGCKGHRILRRVLVGGRHLRLSRAMFLHGRVVTAALAASSRGKAIRLARAKATKETRRRSGARARGRGDRGVRGSIGQQAPWEDNAHARKPPSTETSSGHEGFEARQCVSAAIRRSVLECRETLGTPVIKAARSPRLRVDPRDESRGASWERNEVRVHVDRLGGRSWSDVSRVLSSGRSQGLVESQGASRKEARSTS
jgi:hypothetical protein